jgi:hypothetical protein
VPQVPRIRRTVPSRDAIRSRQPLPVIVTMIWHDGSRDDLRASAIAWTRSEVEVEVEVEVEWTSHRTTSAATGSEQIRSVGVTRQLAQPNRVKQRPEEEPAVCDD